MNLKQVVGKVSAAKSEYDHQCHACTGPAIIIIAFVAAQNHASIIGLDKKSIVCVCVWRSTCSYHKIGVLSDYVYSM